MLSRSSWFFALALFSTSTVAAQDPPPIVMEGVVPASDEDFFFLPFEVPEGIVEIEVEHSDLSSANVLDWGLDDPNGFRGWGGGLSENAIVGVEAASRTYVPGPIPAGTWEVVVGKAVIEELPARYSVTVTLRSEATLPPQPRAPYQDPGALSDEARWYAGDFHVHSEQSGDASPTMEQNMELARSMGLDFIVATEHNTNSGQTLFANIQPDYPDVLLIPGIEWTTYYGHANAFGATEWVDHRVGTRGSTTEAAITAFHDQGALFSINHPQVPPEFPCTGCAWLIEVDGTTIDGVEVLQGRLPGITFWETLMEDGSHAAAIGGSDDHRGGEGNLNDPLYTPVGVPATMVFAEELSVEGILAGIRSGRTVVKLEGPDGPMLETELSGERTDDTVVADEATLSVVVTGGMGLTLFVYKNGEVIDEIEVTSDPFTDEREVVAPEEGEDRYRHQVNDSGGRRPVAIGGYVWLQSESSQQPGTGGSGGDGGSSGSGGSPAEPDDPSGCSCGVVSAAGYDTGFVLCFMSMLGFAWRATARRAPRRP